MLKNYDKIKHLVDSAKYEFEVHNNFYELTEFEKETYELIESLVKNINIIKKLDESQNMILG